MFVVHLNAMMQIWLALAKMPSIDGVGRDYGIWLALVALLAKAQKMTLFFVGRVASMARAYGILALLTGEQVVK